jgi:CheY-like chemotaxis protein
MKRVNCILLIDDDPDDNFLHKIIIEEAGVCNQVQVVKDGESALDYLIQSGESNQSESYPQPDVIFLDINMPRMNGFEFLEEYEKLDEQLKSKIVVVMLTTSSNPNDKIKAATYTAVKEFQNKPLTEELLQEMIKKYF